MSIAIVGEAWGAEEAKQRAPFVGGAGYELTKMLSQAGIHRADCFLTNVFNLHPPGNDLSFVCGPKEVAIASYPKLLRGKEKHHHYYTGDWVRQEFTGELERLGHELVEVNPNLVIALGNTAMWALTGKTTISKLRGTTTISTRCATGFKLLPTYHPAAILRQWSLRPVAVADLQKAKREAEYPDIKRPAREIWIEPTLGDIYEFHERYIEGASLIAVDIETAGRDVTCLGIAPSKTRAIVIPFTNPQRKDGNYWPSGKDECDVWDYLRAVLEVAPPRKLFQNGLYDITFLFRSHGIRVAGAEEDTMLLHYSLQPESLKGLGFLASIYCDEGNWKDMRQHKKTIKRDD